MKRILFFLVVLLSVWSVSYADQTLNGRQPREFSQSVANKILEGKDYNGDTTAFTNLAAVGHNATGNAGYIALQAMTTGGSVQTYYLWVDTGTTPAGVLFMASFPAIKTYSSFPYGSWLSSDGFKAGAKVASQ